ncbi:MAG: 2-phospho-L-lactate guanylyltransferase [Nitrospinae bacterium]|nr:2-phospho-L-lactate guanylyltransferase [Nitrospinota bacterium]
MRYALVPVKDLTHAKARLSALLSPVERRALAAAMLDDVVAALRQASTLDRIAFVTTDATALAMAAQFGFEVIDEGFGRGETGAVELAVKVCVERGASALAVIPADIPLLTAEDVDGIMHHGEHCAVVIVPSWDSRGTNAVLMRPPDALQLRFGSWSFFPHVKQAKRKGLPYKVIRLPRVALDVDTPVDLTRLVPHAAGTRSYSALERMGMLPRLQGLSLSSPSVGSS